MKLAKLFSGRCFKLALVLSVLTSLAVAQYAPGGGDAISRGVGVFVASQYNYSGQNNYITVGNSGTGSQTITLSVSSIKLGDGRTIYPYNITSPIIVGAGASQELVTPTSVTNCYYLTTPGFGSCQITASFSNTHGFGEQVQSGTSGLAEAIYEAYLVGGGQVVVDSQWANSVFVGCTNCYASANAVLNGIAVYPTVGIEDFRGPAPVLWNLQPTQTAGSYLAAPATLTSGTVASSLTVAGSATYAGGTIHVCIAYVDLMGNEGPCSADYSFADTSAKAIVFNAPAASTGAVGYVPYIGLEAGAANHEYAMQLVTQPTAIGSYPVSNGVCTLTLLETTTPACAVTNATYGQTGAVATVTAYPVVTGQQSFQLGGVSSTSYYAPNVIAHNAYAYEPGMHVGASGLITQTGVATVSAALASTVPFVLGSVAIPPGFMNYRGREIEVCGLITDAGTDADTTTDIQLWWDAPGSNVTTGIPVKISDIMITATLTAAANRAFCQDIVTTVPSASATGGTLQAGLGFLTEGQIAAGTIHFSTPVITIAAVGSLNLADNARIDVVFVEATGAADTPQLQNLTVKVLN